MGLTNTGMAVLSGLAGNVDSQTAFTYLALGDGNTAFAASQAALISEITGNGLARASATVSRQTTTQTNDTVRLLKQWTASGSETLKEIGIFNAASSGVMGFRKVLDTERAMTNGDEYTYTYDVIFAAS